MYDLYSIDSHFFIYSIILQLFFSFITLFIAYISYKVHGITQNPQTKSMFLAFLFIFFSYIIQAFLNLFLILKVKHDFLVFMGIHPLSVFNEQGLYIHAVLMTIGFSFLMFNAFKTKDSSILWYLILSSFLVVFLSKNTFMGFFMLTSLYLGFLSYRFYLNFLKHKKQGPFLVAMAFILLFIGHFIFIFSRSSILFYVLAYLFSFIGYLLILANYYIIRK